MTKSADFGAAKSLFGFLVMLYGRVGDGDKLSNENFGLGKHYFHANSQLKIEAKKFFLVNVNAAMQFMNVM